MARIVVAGAGAIGASIAYHLALRGTEGVVLADVGEIAGGATGKAMGGAPAVHDRGGGARAGERTAVHGARCAAFRAGRLPLPGDDRAGLAELEERRELQAALGVLVERVEAQPVRAQGRRRARRDDLPGGRDRRSYRGVTASSCAVPRPSARMCASARTRSRSTRRRSWSPAVPGRRVLPRRAARSFRCGRSCASSPTSAPSPACRPRCR